MPNNLGKQIPYNEFDYLTLTSALKDYRYPRNRIKTLLDQGTIVRVKKGLYIFGDDDRRGPVHREYLANLIYGPSYVSLDYALAYHGWIPERVEVVTSVTTQRAKSFMTPLGRFTYLRVPLAAYRTGVERVDMGQGRAFLLARPAKALADKLYCDRTALTSQKALLAHLVENLRVEEDQLRTLDPEELDNYASRFRSQRTRLLAQLIRRLIRRSGGSRDA